MRKFAGRKLLTWKRMYKEIDIKDKSLFDNNGLSVQPDRNMTLDEAYDFVIDKVRGIYGMKDAI